MTNTTKTVSIPTLHLNGSNGETLMAEIQEAYRKLDEAYAALCQIAPHGRDYYVQGDTAYTKAAADHRDRMGAVYGILGDLRAIGEGIQDQLDLKEAARGKRLPPKRAD